jgi:hypothetical protein
MEKLTGYILYEGNIWIADFDLSGKIYKLIKRLTWSN